MVTLDAWNIGFLVVLVMSGYVVQYLILSRSGSNADFLKGRIESLEGEVEKRDADLNRVRLQSERDRTQADDRKIEIDRLNADLARLRDRIDEEVGKQKDLSGTISRLQAEAEAREQASDEKIAILSRIRDEMETRFANLAQEALRTQGEAFSKANQEKLEKILLPLKEHVDLFHKELNSVHQETTREREHLKAEIGHLISRSEKISHEAREPTLALKSDRQKQGAWGEMILETILDRSGLREGHEYRRQVQRTSREGEQLRPDVVVALPGNKTLVIDSKVSLLAYVDAVDAEDPESAETARKRHLKSLRNHVDVLSSKEYQASEHASVDFVILFVPMEGAFAEAFREDGSITEYAIGRQVMIATPTTLMMALRTVDRIWKVEQRQKNAEEIAKRTGHLYDKIKGFLDSFAKVGESLEGAWKSHQKAFDQLSRGRGNVIRQCEMLRSMGAGTTKRIDVPFEDQGEDVNLVESDGDRQVIGGLSAPRRCVRGPDSGSRPG